MGDELGGHIVSGHVDGLAKLETIMPDGDSYRLVITVPDEFKKFVASKGSIALEGISLIYLTAPLPLPEVGFR